MPAQPIATIYGHHIRDNYQLAKRLNQQQPCYAVVKAQAYGHHCQNLVHALADADGFAVARYDEALELRQLGIEQEIVVLSDELNAEHIKQAQQFKLTPCLQNVQDLQLLQSYPEAFSKLWLTVDTGMHRQGIDLKSIEQAGLMLRALLSTKTSLVLMTHLACSDTPLHPLNTKQLNNFQHAIDSLEKQGVAIHSLSIANSGALLNQLLPELPYPHIARPGIMLYGINPSTERSTDGLKMAMQLNARILDIRTIETGETVGYGGDNPVTSTTQVATLGIGYGDGFPRYIDAASVKVGEQMCPTLGRVSMDLLCIDVTGVANINIGDSVEIWGPNTDIKPLANASQTLSYELLTRLTQRVKRVRVD